MIRIDRRSVQVPAALSGPNSLGAEEAKRNEQEARKQPPGKMSFKAYKDASVREALDQLFQGKCAYCESLLRGSQPGDVEHYRPKGIVHVHDSTTGRTEEKSGYYWLAADWNNLLLSCADCNRPRVQQGRDLKRRKMGKANLFPLADEARRALGPAQLAGEDPLLLDPCKDDPDEHLAFTDDAYIEPRFLLDTFSSKGVATIQVCSLDRFALAQARMELRYSVMSSIQSVKEALRDGRDPSRHIDDLTRYTGSQHRYSGFARYLVRKHLQPLFAEIGF